MKTFFIKIFKYTSLIFLIYLVVVFVISAIGYLKDIGYEKITEVDIAWHPEAILFVLAYRPFYIVVIIPVILLIFLRKSAKNILPLLYLFTSFICFSIELEGAIIFWRYLTFPWRYFFMYSYPVNFNFQGILGILVPLVINSTLLYFLGRYVDNKFKHELITK